MLPIVVLLLLDSYTSALMCYTCRGACYQKAPCNCYTGMCEGDYCFSSGEQSEEAGSSIVVEKGCIRRPSLTTMGCEYQRQPSQVLCVCNNTDFCNENTLNGGQTSSHLSNSCYDCRRGDYGCPRRCRGDYCVFDTVSKEQSCGYGMPVLPFHRQSRQLLPPLYDAQDKSSACATLKLGDDVQHFQCACNGTDCNEVGVTREDPWMALNKRYVTCYRCQTVSDGFGMTACSNGTCVGEYCILRIRNYSRPKASYVHSAGCMNSTSSPLVNLGCAHRWILDVKEEIDCTCDADYCNADLQTANAISSSTWLRASATVLLLVGIMFCSNNMIYWFCEW